LQEIKLFATTIAQTVGDGSLFTDADRACPAPAAPRIQSTERKSAKQWGPKRCVHLLKLLNDLSERKVFQAVVVDHGRADAALAAFAKATGFEAVTLEQRLTNFLTHTHQRLGVPLRSMPR
jgi:hypothetical protein